MFRLTEVHLRTFEQLKNSLACQPVLCLYSPTAETELHCDVSASGFGAILLQRQESDRKFHPVMFFSKRTSECEAKYHSYELECLAAVYAIKRFHVYLHSRKFKIVTDCDSFRLTLKKTLYLGLTDGRYFFKVTTTKSNIGQINKCNM